MTALRDSHGRFIPNEAGEEYLFASVEGPVGQMLARIANRAANYARENVSGDYVNVDTGYLRSSIGYEVQVEGGTVVIAIVYAKASYAKFLHDGTIYIEPRPFLTDAVSKAVDET